jgi:hypothetical protein
MRLTLRTVLAYLEDALPPEDARRIGRMIGRSPAARRIVARIRKVVRRRRLIAVKPDSDSKKGMDANDMSEYLDNVLPEDKLERVERRCLKHDALLAEAAACHQILSRVLGEAPPVNEDARLRAYSAVGVLATTPTNIAVVGSPNQPVDAAKPGTNDAAPDLPIPTFAMPESSAGRAALVTLVGLLFVALGLVLWRGLEPGPVVMADSRENEEAVQPKEKPAPAVVENKETPLVVNAKKNEPIVVLNTPEPKKEALPPTPTPANKEPNSKPPEAVDRKSPPPAPVPSLARAPDAKAPVQKAADYTATSGVLCRLRKEGPERLQTNSAVNVGDVLVNLEGWRSELKLISGDVIDLVDGVKIAVRSGAKPVFEIRRGRMLVRAVNPTSLTLGIGPDDFVVRMAKPNALVTIEYLPAASIGGTETPAAALVGAISDNVTLEFKGRKLELAKAHLVDVAVGRGFGTPHPETTPVWLTGSQLSPADMKASDRLNERNAIPFGTQGLVDSLQARAADRNRDVRKMALRALAALEVYPAVVDALRDERFADNRAAAFTALRSVTQTDPEGTAAIRQALLHSIPGEEADEVIRLLRGYNRQEFANATIAKRLVALLDSETLMIRELAIRNLKDATGKDFGYNAVEPAARRASAVKQWESFVRERR